MDNHNNEILVEDGFRRVLCWERKKAERFGWSLLLMLVDVEGAVQANHSESALCHIVSALSASTRETDIAGWYQEDKILAVLFSEIRKTERASMQELIHAKVLSELRARLDPQSLGLIQFSFHFFPEEFNEAGLKRSVDVKLYPDLLKQDEAKKFPAVVKRSIDVLGSILALVLCSPLWGAISLAIKLTSEGPVLFKQERVGRYGRRFTFVKFRSMKCANDPSIHKDYVRRFIGGNIDTVEHGTNGKAPFKIQDDPRVTPVGRFLRKTSLDELPQLLNVLKGEMSLVGPRPPIPYELEAYQVWHRQRLLEAKPGITGLWQVRGRSRLKFDDMVRLDLQYSKSWSIWLDLKILFQTPWAVLSGDGAY